MTCLKAKTFEDNWCPFQGHFSTFAQTKIPTKMDTKNPNFRAFEGLCSKYSQFQKYLKQYTKCLVLREVEPGAGETEGNKKDSEKGVFNKKWCRWPESNRHVVAHTRF